MLLYSFTSAILIVFVAESRAGRLRNKTLPRSQKELVDWLRSKSSVVSKEVADAMYRVDRKYYVEEGQHPYQNIPQPMGFNANMSSPHMHAHALETLKNHLKEGNKALDVGCGSGYLTMCMALMVGKTGYAVGVDHVPDLINKSKIHAINSNPKIVERNQVMFVEGDGRDGVADKGPYDAIYVGAASPGIPVALFEQLKNGGRMLYAIGLPYNTHNFQEVKLLDKFADDHMYIHHLGFARYYLLTDKNRQLSKYYPNYYRERDSKETANKDDLYIPN